MFCLFAFTHVYPGFGESTSCCSVGNSRASRDVDEACATSEMVCMSVPEEDDSKSDTTQNLFKHSPVPPPPLSPSSLPLPRAAGMFLRRTVGWLSIRNRGEALHRPDALPPPSLARSMQEVKVRIPGRPSVSRSRARRQIDARITVRKDGGSARRVAQHVALFLHFAHMQGDRSYSGGRRQGKGKQCDE